MKGSGVCQVGSAVGTGVHVALGPSPFPQPHTWRGRAVPGELGLHLLADLLPGSDWERMGQGYQTSTVSVSREPHRRCLIAFTDVWPPSGGVSH